MGGLYVMRNLIGIWGHEILFFSFLFLFLFFGF